MSIPNVLLDSLPAPIGLSLQILCLPNAVSTRLLIPQLGLRPFSSHPAVDFILPRLDEHRLSRFQVWFIIVLGQLLLLGRHVYQSIAFICSFYRMP